MKKNIKNGFWLLYERIEQVGRDVENKTYIGGLSYGNTIKKSN